MKIGFIFTSRPEVGGGYTYETKCLEILSGLSSDLEIATYHPVSRNENLKRYKRVISSSGGYSNGILTKLGVWIRSSLVGLKVASAIGFKYSKLEKRLVRDGIDLVYFGAPNFLALGIVDLPMVTTVWDLGHRTKPEYPEFRENGAFVERDTYFRMACQRSVYVVVDSLTTSNALQSMYGIESSRICISGLLPDIDFWVRDSDSVGGEPRESSQFILYPAQFWPHKRHNFLISVLEKLRESHPDLRLVLTGSDQGFLNSVQAKVHRKGLDDAVEFRGFVAMRDLRELYATASCIAFPSDLGPTNLPPLEACLIGKQVICSSTAVEGLPALAGIIRVPEYDITKWCDAMAICISNPATPERVSAEAKSLLSEQQSTFESKLSEILTLLSRCGV